MATDQEEQADDVEEKMRLEGLFLPFVLSAFSDERSLFSRSVRANGTTPLEDELLEIWRPVISEHMQLTGREFKIPAPEPDIDEQITMRVFNILEDRAEGQARAVAFTSKNNMDKSVDLARRSFTEEGQDFTDVAIAAVGLRFLTPTQQARETGIVVTATQAAAETSKGVSAIIQGKRNKTWITMGDERVRPTHVVADGQRVPANQPFTVGGSLLMYPGDVSLGADLGEIVNCRCSAVYE